MRNSRHLLLVVILIVGWWIAGCSGGDSATADDDDQVPDDDTQLDDDQIDDDLVDDDQSPDDDTAADDDHDDTSESALSFCEFSACERMESLKELAAEMLHRGETYCGSLNSNSSVKRVLRIDDLVSERDQNEVLYYIRFAEDWPDYKLFEYRFYEKNIGHFYGLLYMPKVGSPPYRAILMSHGHADDAGIVFHLFGGYELVRNGVVVLSQGVSEIGWEPNPPDDPDRPEKWDTYYFNEIERNVFGLLPFNRTAYGDMIYRSILMLDFLQNELQIEPDRIGLWGHSGGSHLSENLMAVDDRAKVGIIDWQGILPNEDTNYRDYAREVVIPQFFCWGDGDRFFEMTAGKIKHYFDYGYPDPQISQAVDTLLADLGMPVNCGNGLCGPGENYGNCANDCRDSGPKATFAEGDDGIMDHPSGFTAVNIGLSNRYWETHKKAESLVHAMEKRTSLHHLNGLLDCLPNAIDETTTDSWGHTKITREYCFGPVGKIDVDIYVPRGSELGEDPLVLFMTNRERNIFMNQDDLRQGMLNEGYALLEPHYLFAEHTLENANSIFELLPFGFSLHGLYLWMSELLLTSIIFEFDMADTPVVAYGCENLALVALHLKALDKRIRALATGLTVGSDDIWHLWEPDYQPQRDYFYPTAYFYRQAKLGNRDEVFAELVDETVKIFNMMAVASFDLTQFYNMVLGPLR